MKKIKIETIKTLNKEFGIDIQEIVENEGSHEAYLYDENGYDPKVMTKLLKEIGAKIESHGRGLQKYWVLKTEEDWQNYLSVMQHMNSLDPSEVCPKKHLEKVEKYKKINAERAKRMITLDVEFGKPLYDGRTYLQPDFYKSDVEGKSYEEVKAEIERVYEHTVKSWKIA